MHDVARVQQGAIVEANAGAQMKEIGAAIGRDFPARGERWPDLRVWAEASESVEQVRHRAAGWNIGRERGVERFRIVAVACIDERATVGGVTAAAGSEQQERNE